MDRIQELTKYISKEKLGIEIGPWFSPIAPKRDGYNCLSLDIFDRETLRKRAEVDPHIPKEKIAHIESVDLIGSSVEIDKIAEEHRLLQKVDYILSSHNFEHLPNPIRFLQGCTKILKPGGIVSMAIPDLRTCFDYFRPHTTLGEWLEAYFIGREKPSLKQLFEQESLRCEYQKNSDSIITFFVSDDPTYITPCKTLEQAFNQWKTYLAMNDTNYHDAHCSTFTPTSFELLLSDLQFLELCQLKLIEITETNGCEFYVHLQRHDVLPPLDADSFYEKRKMLLHRLNNEKASNCLASFRLTMELQAHQKEIAQLKIEREECNNFIKNQIEMIQKLQQEIESLQKQIQSMKTSKSWRLTSPFRFARTWLRRKQAVDFNCKK